jgi:hypothetical protein
MRTQDVRFIASADHPGCGVVVAVHSRDPETAYCWAGRRISGRDGRWAPLERISGLLGHT